MITCSSDKNIEALPVEEQVSLLKKFDQVVSVTEKGEATVRSYERGKLEKVAVKVDKRKIRKPKQSDLFKYERSAPKVMEEKTIQLSEDTINTIVSIEAYTFNSAPKTLPEAVESILGEYGGELFLDKKLIK